MVNVKYLFCVTLTEEDEYSPFREKGWSSDFKGEKGKIHPALVCGYPCRGDP
jgi:hypothetical protein